MSNRGGDFGEVCGRFRAEGAFPKRVAFFTSGRNQDVTGGYIYTFIALFELISKVLADMESCYKLKSELRLIRSFENIEVKIRARTSILVNGGRKQEDRHDIEMSQN